MSALDDVVAALRELHDEALADLSTAQLDLDGAQRRRRAIEAALCELEPLTGEELAATADPLPVVDLLAAKRAAEAETASPPSGLACLNCDHLGHDDTGCPGPDLPRRRAKWDYARVAEVARTAIAEGQVLRDVIRAEFDVNDDMATWLVRQARALGHDIPKMRRGPKPATATPVAAPQPEATPATKPLSTWTPASTWTPRLGENVISCPDCTAMFPAINRGSAAQHVYDTHGRIADRSELLPRTWTGAA